jgi:hypothetical protein
LYHNIPLGYGVVAMRYRIELLLRAIVDDASLHDILMGANTYAIVEKVEATHDKGGEDYRFTARIDAPSPEAALGSLLTVLAQTSGHVGLVEEASLHRVVIEREEPPDGSG